MRAFLLGLLLGAPSRAEVRNPDTFVYALPGDVITLDPHWQYDTVSHAAAWQLYETLLIYKGTSTTELAPLLSEKVPTRANGLVSPDARVYTFPIRPGVRFHDGTPMTAEDVRYSILRYMLLDRAGGGSALLLEPILGLSSVRGADGKPLPGAFAAADGAVRLRGNSVEVTLKRPFAPFLSILAAFCPVMPKAWIAANGGWDGAEASWGRHVNSLKEALHSHERANGTGPFALERWDRQAKQLTMVRNERYWRKPAALKRLVFQVVDEFGARKLLLSVGDADAISLERQFLPQLAGLEGVVVEDDLPLLEVHNPFVFNFKIDVAGNPYAGSGRLDGAGIPSDFFADLDVRRGFAHAFDYEAYIRDGYRGAGRRSRGPIPYVLDGHDPAVPLTAHDPAKAEEHLRRAFGGEVWEKGFRFTLAHQQGRADRELACQILKRGLERLNPRFRVDVYGLQWSTYIAALSGRKIPMVNGRWMLDYPDPHNCVHAFLHSAGYFPASMGYRNPRADALVEKAAAEADPARRRALYRELQALAREELPALFTLDTRHQRARRAWVRGWDYNPMMAYGYFYPVRKTP